MIFIISVLNDVRLIHVQINKKLQSQVSNNNMREMLRNCAIVSTIDNMILAGFSNGQFPEEENVKDYSLCVSRRLGYLNDADEFDLDVLRSNFGATFGRDKVEDFVQRCYNPGPNSKHTAYNLIKCQYIYDPTLFSP